MRRNVAFPFLVIPDECVSFEGWLIGDPGQPLVPTRDLLENWDYHRDLEVAATVRLDIDRVKSALDLTSGDINLAAVLRCGSGTGTVPRRLDTLASTLISPTTPEATLSGTVHGRLCSGRLFLDLSVLLDRPPASPGLLSPRIRGARLWQTNTDILLEDGDSSRFPVEAISFSRAFTGLPHASAPWYLDWVGCDLDADFAAVVRVYINSDIPSVAERFANTDPLILQAVLGDVMSQMIDVMLDRSRDEPPGEFAENSVGYQIGRWIEMAFPDQTIGAIRAQRESFPGRFRAAILAAAEVGDQA